MICFGGTWSVWSLQVNRNEVLYWIGKTPWIIQRNRRQKLSMSCVFLEVDAGQNRLSFHRKASGLGERRRVAVLVFSGYYLTECYKLVHTTCIYSSIWVLEPGKFKVKVLAGSMSAEDLFPSTTSHFWRKERALSCPWEPLGRRHLHDLIMQQRPHLKICSYKESNLNVCILRVHKSMAVGVQKSVKEKPCKDCKVCL